MQKKLYQTLLIAALIIPSLEQARAEGEKALTYLGSDCENQKRCGYILSDGATVTLTDKSIKEITRILAHNIQKDGDGKYSSTINVNGKEIILEYQPR